jgi:hypothetical protein
MADGLFCIEGHGNGFDRPTWLKIFFHVNNIVTMLVLTRHVTFHNTFFVGISAQKI